MEECLEFAREDECVEVTPEATRIRKVELDPAGGNTFTVMGTTQLLSVPYAMYANVPGVAGP